MVMKTTDEWRVASSLLNVLNDYNHEAYIVGGAVRNWLLQKPAEDLDIVTSAPLAEIADILPEATVIETSVPLLTMKKESVRVDISALKGESLEENLAARDFTVNAIAVNAKGAVIDPFHGQKDVHARVLRLLHDEAIAVDPLRILRAARLMANDQFLVDEATVNACKTYRYRLTRVPGERVGDELNRLLYTEHASKGFQWLAEQDIIAVLSPGTPDTSFTFSALDMVDTLTEKWVVFFFQLGEEHIRTSLRKWRRSERLIKNVERLFFYTRKRLKSGWSRQRLYEAGQALAVAAEKTAHALSGNVPGGRIDVCRQIAALPISSRQDLAVHPLEISTYIDREPDAWLGEVLQELEKAVVDGEVSNERAAILAWVEEVIS
ncbi:hypothetical protein [Natribacillus halophilus]|uniref:tRNA nucleotidyltransferase (CCA-adding enzyme) n=1 Tax=Natribacillus halophilus TaxID=549003 RepID=A0A1G8JAL5_9BACI|nr:hypothetical protein [Natribacillus halophilus]SDI28226.1 tRNA nucleotidyltransferase (CCA-adding enzyme) [Natribacillus halophilus]